MANGQEMRAEWGATQRNEGDEIRRGDNGDRKRRAGDPDVDKLGQSSRQSRQPRPTKKQKDCGAVDAKQPERRDDGGDAPKDHHRARDEAERDPAQRPSEPDQDRVNTGLEQPSHGDCRQTEHDAH